MSQLPALSFNDVQFDVVDIAGHPWLPARQIGFALGYKDDRSIQRIYSRNADEFTESMTRVVNLTTPSGSHSKRIFSLRGAHLIAMFARTKVAKDFRKWVLDVLDHHLGQDVAGVPLTASTKDQRKPLRDVVTSWCVRANIQYPHAWKQVQAAFNLNNISELPAEWIPDACQWVQKRIDELKYLPPNEETWQRMRAEIEKTNRHLESLHGELLTMSKKSANEVNAEVVKALSEAYKNEMQWMQRLMARSQRYNL